MQRAPDTLNYIRPVAGLLGVALICGGIGFTLNQPGWGIRAQFVCLALAFAVCSGGFSAFGELRSSRSMVAALDPRLGCDAIWISEGSQEMGTNAGTGFYLGEDASGGPRIVLVMDDDDRRPQPRFGSAPRGYAIGREELAKIWAAPQPAVFFTDPLRADFSKDPPRLPENAGDPVAQFGYRRVYANPAARERLVLGGELKKAEGEGS